MIKPVVKQRLATVAMSKRQDLLKKFIEPTVFLKTFNLKWKVFQRKCVMYLKVEKQGVHSLAVKSIFVKFNHKKASSE